MLLVFFTTAVSAQTDNSTSTDMNEVINNDYTEVSTNTTSNVMNDTKSTNINSNQNNSSKISPDITVPNKTAKTNTSVVLEAQVPDDAKGQALFKINGLTIGEAFRINGGLVKYDYKIPIYSSKNYTITFVYGGNNKYESKRTESILTLTKLNTTATIKSNRTTLAQGESVRFDVDIKNELNNGIVDAFAIKVNGQSIGVNKTGIDGKGYLYYTIPSTYKINNYTVELVYGDTNTAIGKRINSTLRINNPTRIKLDNISKTKTHGLLKLKSIVLDKLSNNVTSGEVVYKINGITMGSVNVTNGVAIFEYQLPLYAPRNYTITALFGGNRYYKPSSTNGTLTLLKTNTNLSTQDTLNVGRSNNINITAVDGSNNPIDNFNLRLLINKKEVGSYHIENGTVIIDYELNNLDSTKPINATVIFDANKFYEKSTLEINVTNPTTITLSDIPSNKTTGTIYLNATVTDGLNNNVNGGKVEFKLDDRSLFNITVKDGQVKSSYRLSSIEAKKHNITAVYHGNDYYQDSSTSKEFTAELSNIKLSTRNKTMIVNKANEMNITVKDEFNKNVPNGTIRLLINNNEVAKYDVVNSKAVINYTLNNINPTKQTTAILVYDANNFYNESTMNITIINPTKINISTADTKTTKLLYINATVIDSFNRNVSSGEVEFYLDGKPVLNATVNNGLVKTSYRLPLITGQVHNLTAKYLGYNNYQTSNTTESVNILKLNTKITPIDVNLKVGSFNKTDVKVLDELNNPVQKGILRLYVNNQEIGNFSVKNGTSKVIFQSPNNNSNCVMNYKLEYIDNHYYINSTATAKINVLPLNVVYVSKNGNDDNLGDVKHPYKTIKHATSHVNADGIVYINPGEYDESNIILNQSTNIYGINSSSNVIINPSQNGYIFNNINTTSNLTLVNITIRNAKINAVNSSAVISKGPLTVFACNFENNQATAADSSSSIYASNYLAISSSNFNKNSAKSNGGAIKALGHRVIILNSKFTNNSINANNAGGAAIYINTANTTIDTSVFSNNQVNGINVTGGAIKKVSGNLTVMRTNMAYNKLTGSGYNIGGAIINLNGYLCLINSTINSNNVSSTNNCGAAGIYSQNSVTAIYNSTITSNNALGKNVFGGAIQNFNTFLILSSTNFTYNTATATNGQVVGAAINQNNGSVSIENSRFHRNTARASDAYAGALYFVGNNITINQTQFNQNIANGTNLGAAGAVFVNANSSIYKCNFTSNQALGKSNGGGAIISALNLTANNNNFISNVASATGSAISNSGKNININNNYWGSSSPSWTKLLHGVTQPSKYSTTAL